MIEINDLKATLICCRQHTRAARPESGEYSALFAIEHPETGEKGHWAYIIEWDKRDIMLEQAHTNNPTLTCHEDEHEGPSTFDWGRIRDDIGVEPTKHPEWPGCSTLAYGEPS